MSQVRWHPRFVATAVLTLVIPVCLPASCGRDQGHSNDKIVGAEANDPRLAAATAEARRRWNEFVTEFHNAESGTTYLIKAPFTAKNGAVEHMWATVTSVNTDTVTGLLASDPYAEFAIKQGDQVTIKLAELDDWYVQKPDSTILGNFSEPVLELIEKEQAGK